MTPRRTTRTGATAVALVLLLVPPTGSLAQGGAESEPIGALSIPGKQSALARDLLGLLAVALGRVPESDPLHALARELSAPAPDAGARFWRIEQPPEGEIALASQDAPAAAPGQAYALDLSLDLAALRRVSPQPFSRSWRGRALDALGIDNARRARLVLLPAAPDEEPLALILFFESRAEAPGRWHALPLAQVRRAPTRGEAPPEAPLEIDLSEQWSGVVLSLADLLLARDTDTDAISTAERFEAWGPEKLDQLMALAAGLEGRVWLWRSGPDRAVLALPLRRGATDRSLASSLRAVLGARLDWRRAADGRAIATLSCGTADGSPPVGPTLALRFITIQDTTILAIAATEADLDAAPAILAKLAR